CPPASAVISLWVATRSRVDTDGETMSTQNRRPSLTTLGAALAAGLAGLGGLGLLGAPTAAGATIPRPPAPLHGVGTVGALPGRYIVVLKGGAVTRDGSTPAMARAARVGVRVERRFGRALHGFAAALSGSQLAVLRADPDVAYIEADQVVHADTTT